LLKVLSETRAKVTRCVTQDSVEELEDDLLLAICPRPVLHEVLVEELEVFEVGLVVLVLVELHLFLDREKLLGNELRCTVMLLNEILGLEKLRLALELLLQLADELLVGLADRDFAVDLKSLGFRLPHCGLELLRE